MHARQNTATTWPQRPSISYVTHGETKQVVEFVLEWHGFRLPVLVYLGTADCSKTATLFSSRFGQALELVAVEVLQKQPSDIIGYDWR